MTNLVTIQNGTPVTTTLAIAEGTKVAHKNVIELVRTYSSDLKRFGGVAFETRSFERELVKTIDKDDVRKVDVIDNLGRKQKAWAANESGMYQALLGAPLHYAQIEAVKYVGVAA